MVSAGLATHAGRYLWDLRTPMRDGVELSSDVYLPEGGLRGGPYPVVLVRTPDNNQAPRLATYARHLSEHGFAVALQDVRGRNDSGGTFHPFHGEAEDGYDTIEWFAAQPWCDGRVGLAGSFYEAWAAWQAAKARPPHLEAMVSASPLPVIGGPPTHRNGALRLPLLAWLHAVGGRAWQDGSQVDWPRVLGHLPLRTTDRALGRALPAWHEWLDHPTFDEHWRAIQLSTEDLAAIDLPVRHDTGWYDESLQATVDLHEAMRAHSPAARHQTLLIGPWDRHGAWQPRPDGPDAAADHDGLIHTASTHASWFGRWLTDVEEGQEQQLETSRSRVTGVDIDVSRSGELRDAATSTRTLHLDGGATASGTSGHLRETAPSDSSNATFSYDPTDPVVVTTDLTFFPMPPLRPVDPPRDRRPIERRADVLTYTMDEAIDDFLILGSPELRLFVGSDCPDTDWVVHLTEVAPSGASVVIADGVLRGRHRNGLDREVFMEPGETYELDIELSPVAHQVRAGHRLRLAITSSLFPLLDRNLNTGPPIGTDEAPRVATNTVFHDPARPSRLILPVAAGLGS